MSCKRQSILLISIDNLRNDCISINTDRRALASHHHRDIQTPTIDELAGSGTYFKRCFSSAPYTTASHASILTGCFPNRHGVREYYRHAISTSTKTVFELFKELGYCTILAADFPFLLGDNLGFNRGVDHYLVTNDRKFLDLLLNSELPCLAFLHIGSVHNPFGLTSLAYDGEYYLEKVEDVASRCGIDDQKQLEREWIEKDYPIREKLLRQKYFKCIDHMYGRRQYSDLMDLYVEGINYVDGKRLSEIMAILGERGFLKSNLLAMTADHGEEYSDRAFAHYNGLWEGIVNVPLIFAGADVAEGVISDRLVRTVDIVPTLLELSHCSQNVPESIFDGVSVFGDSKSSHLRAYGETWFGHTEQILDFMALCKGSNRLLKSRRMANQRVEYVRTSDHKLIVSTDLDMGKTEMYLFDVEKDRLEIHDFSNEQPNKTDEMLGLLESYRNQFQGENVDLELEEMNALRGNLKDLGYLKNL